MRGGFKVFQYFEVNKIDVVFVPRNINTERNTFKEIVKKLRTLIYGIACTEFSSQTLQIKTYNSYSPLLP